MNEAPLLAVRNLRKRFGDVHALRGVDCDFRAGEIHAVLGENGAGKSTLMHVLAGVCRPDAGSIVLDGKSVAFASSRAARSAGIGMVHQHFTLIDTLTVAENLALSLPRRSRWRFDARAAAAAANALAARVGLEPSPGDAPVSALSVGACQRLEIVKALAGAGRVLILDEPTAVLTPQEVKKLFAILRALRAQGRVVIFITHKLREVKEIADRVTIMRGGRVVSACAVGDLGERDMAERMVGTVPSLSARVPRRYSERPVVLQVSQLSARDRDGPPALVDVSIAVRTGEIFGIAGVDGNGQRELFEVLVGLRRPTTGVVRVGGQPLSEFTPRAALAAGIRHIPPDRQREGLVLLMTVEENLLLSRSILDQFSRHGLLHWGAARRFASDLARQYALRCEHLGAPAASLSGGNAQRIIIARGLAQQPAVLVAVNPTRGLDVTAAVGMA
ncbi:MAG: ABC transporter ATP-binding protein, partial [Candidatus Binatia bacterium]